jgi:hypothetical protein
MTEPLSPAAQAVFSAWAKPVNVDRSLVVSGQALEAQAREALAAALRAVADQVVPEFWHEDDDIYGETMQDVRRNLLAIAAELGG